MKLSSLLSKKVVESWMKPNCGQRTLLESIMVPEVRLALSDWRKANIEGCVLIGGLAVSYHGLARSTADGDFLFRSEDEIPISVEGFKRTRPHSFLHLKTHVEIEVLDAKFLKIDQELVDMIYNTSTKIDGIRVASREGLIASKLNRFSRQDQADIEHVLKDQTKIDLLNWPLSNDLKQKFINEFGDLS